MGAISNAQTAISTAQGDVETVSAVVNSAKIEASTLPENLVILEGSVQTALTDLQAGQPVTEIEAQLTNALTQCRSALDIANNLLSGLQAL